MRLATGRKTQEQRLELLANYDDLTGHFNKKRLREVLDHQLAASLRAGNSGAFLAVGIDKLATINDAFGYDAADQVLIEVGRRLDRCLRVSDVVGRVGGDRFGVILAHCSEANVNVAAEKILASVSRTPIETASGPIYATISIGSTIFPDQAKTSYEVMTRAKSRFVRSQARRPRLFCALSPLGRATPPPSRRHGARRESPARAQGNRLPLAYQPVVDAVTGEVDYYECLLRMIDEDGRIVAAGAFVAAIEQMGFIRVIDRYVLETAVQEISAHPGFCLGINISGITATDRAWLRAVTAMLKDKPEIANRLLVEITETAALHDLEKSARFVSALRDLGCRVALDDFGAGFTSLRHLQALAVDTVKIDGSFVRNLMQSEDNRAFLRHLVGLANTLGLHTVAEMVETAEEAEILKREGVKFLQGYHFGKPTLEKPWLAPAQKRATGTGS